MNTAPVLSTRPLFDMTVTLAAPQTAETVDGVLSTHIATGGAVCGDRVAGRVLAGGGDWVRIDAAGVGHIDVRVQLETVDLAVIHMSYLGRLVFRDDALERLVNGELLSAEDTYFRIAPLFAAPKGKYGWLNEIQAVGSGRLLPSAVHYEFHEIL